MAPSIASASSILPASSTAIVSVVVVAVVVVVVVVVVMSSFAYGKIERETLAKTAILMKRLNGTANIHSKLRTCQAVRLPSGLGLMSLKLKSGSPIKLRPWHCAEIGQQ